jgi:SNF2 family DNA or RNA helicase
MHKPFEHQKATSRFLVQNKKAFCFNEQGTGKTASAIWACELLFSKNIIDKVLVICPLSIMESAWVEDINKFVPHRSTGVAHGTPTARKAVLEKGADYTIINYAGVEILEDNLRDYKMIIVDEATHYKNARTKRWKALNRIVKKDTWLWLMTGTPAAQGPLDAYGLAKLVNPISVPRAFSVFRDKIMYRVTNFKWIPRPMATQHVFDILQPAIRFSKEECLDLPPMIYTRRAVELSRQQKKYYKLLLKEMMFRADGEEITAVNAASCLNKLLQISAGVVYSTEKASLEFDIDYRYKVLREVIDESSKKVLIFVPFRNSIDLITMKLRGDGIPTEVIHGGVPVTKRSEIFKNFQTTDDPRVLVIQPQSAAHGVTLTAANTVVWWSPTSSLETYAQANARVHRAGQDHKCTVIQLQGSGVEKRYWALLDSKTDVHTKIIDLYNEMID